ncbi:hypothetical protein [Streptomyces sp. NPDC047706]|uniref:hypothetical protein n=1 Tax=Streptomyces sp. NPDC047706 TaxID=3365486 RepID=UPI003713E8DA
MTARPAPPVDLAALPPTVVIPGLLTGLGVTRRQVPAWITDPAVAESIASGLYDIDDDLVTRDQPSLQQIEKRLAFAACFYLICQRARVAHLEQRLTAAHNHAGLEAS